MTVNPTSSEFAPGRDSRLLLIHDLFSDTTSWSEQLQGFEREFSVLNFALSGHRGAPDFGQDLPGALLEENRTRLEEVVRDSGILSVVAHGHSARLALDLAAAFPDSVENLVLVSPVLSPHALLEGLPRFMPFFYELFFVFGDTLGEKGPSLKRPFERLAALPPSGARRWVDEWRKQEPLDMGMIQARTLILAGDRLPRLPDPPVSEINESLANSHLIRYAGLGHCLHMEGASSINPVLMDFLLRPEGFLQKGLESFVGFIKGLFNK